MRIIKLILRFYETALKRLFEFRFVTVMDILTLIMAYASGYLATWILLTKFHSIQGWTLYEVILLFNINMVAHGLGSFSFRWPMLDMERMTRQGDFDMALIRPMNPLVYTLLGRPTFAYFGNYILGAIVFVLCFTHLAIHITILKVAFLLLAILGASLIHSAIYLSVGALSFWVVKTGAVFSMINSLNNFTDYPITIYGKVIQVLLTFLVPFAFINFYPAYNFLDKQGGLLFSPVIQYGTPLVGMVFFFLAYRLWKLGVKNYKSTGS